MTTISFVIPVYRNAGALQPTYEKVRTICASLQGYSYEFVFVDDGSDDGSLAELLSLRDRDDRVRVVTFTRNFGQMAALLAGLKAAAGDVVITLSADLQDPPELIPQMVSNYEHGSEIVMCYRKDREDGLMARITSRLFYRIVRISFPQIPAGGFDFVLLARTVVDAFNSIEARNRFFQGDLLWFGHRTTCLPYTRLKRTIGRSQYTFAKRFKNSMDAILDSSYLPIRFISLVGVVVALTGFVYAVDIAYTRIWRSTPFTGWAPIMILILIIGGLLMVMLGIIGEYVWRIYDEVKGKPNYVIRTTYGDGVDG